MMINKSKINYLHRRMKPLCTFLMMVLIKDIGKILKIFRLNQVLKELSPMYLI